MTGERPVVAVLRERQRCGSWSWRLWRSRGDALATQPRLELVASSQHVIEAERYGTDARLGEELERAALRGLFAAIEHRDRPVDLHRRHEGAGAEPCADLQRPARVPIHVVPALEHGRQTQERLVDEPGDHE